MQAIHRFGFPTQIELGPGAAMNAAGHLRAQGLARPLIVTDRGVAGMPFFDRFGAFLRRNGLNISVFSGVHGNPTRTQALAGLEAFRRHGADSIVGVGGGAALDVAKAVALAANHPGDLFDYEDGKPGALPIDRDIPYWIAVPTVAGTGSEVGRSSVISEDSTRRKKILFSPKLLARAVFADPELTLALPPHLTAATGMDALTHCVEAYLAKGYHPICDGIALEGVRLISRSLARAVRQPSNVEARKSMLMASMMGAIAFQKGLGITHSCAHALGAVSDLHHGLANGIMIDHALAHNLPVVPDRFESLAAAAATERSFISWLKELKRETGIPAGLSQAHADRRSLERLVELAAQDGCHLSNPRPCERSDFRTVFEEAFDKC